MTVTDSSPLIGLARIGAFSLLEDLFGPGTLAIPPGVYHEVVARGQGRPGDPEVRAGLNAGWIRVETPAQLVAPPYQGMHRGEIEAISLALQLGCTLLVDEGPGRERAKREGLFCRGTLDVLVLAKCSGAIPSVKPKLDALRAANFYLSDDHYDEVLRKVGE